jgi:DNA-binding transcriptional regulator YhcF (GntR family)
VTLPIDLSDRHGGPLHEQIAASLRRAIAHGELTPGARLPSAKELARRLGVNVNTVLRAYRQLDAEDLVELRRGRGATVRGEPDLARLYALADELLAEAARQGLSRGELAALLAQRS